MDVYFEANSSVLNFYNPYNFDRNIPSSIITNYQKNCFDNHIKNNEFVEVIVENTSFIFIYKKLEWDTHYFNLPTYKLIHVLGTNHNHLIKAIDCFNKTILPINSYCFIEVPSEDIKLIQALGSSSYKLVETRLTYYNNQLHKHNYQRYDVRSATKNDIPNLKQVASIMRNDFDRFHADAIFDVKIADEFLSTYIENSILGFSDYVMCPNEALLPSDSFLTANYLRADWEALNYKISKMVLSAVSAQTNKGWYIKLVSEMMYHLRDSIGSECIFLNTQATNRAVVNTWEKLHYKLGCTTHILSYSK